MRENEQGLTPSTEVQSSEKILGGRCGSMKGADPPLALGPNRRCGSMWLTVRRRRARGGRRGARGGRRGAQLGQPAGVYGEFRADEEDGGGIGGVGGGRRGCGVLWQGPSVPVGSTNRDQILKGPGWCYQPGPLAWAERGVGLPRSTRVIDPGW